MVGVFHSADAGRHSRGSEAKLVCNLLIGCSPKWNVVGTWKGKVEIDPEAAGKLSAKELSDVKALVARDASASELHLFKDGTFQLSNHDAGGSGTEYTGTWTLSGDLLKRTDLTLNGKAIQSKPAQYKVVDGGKKLVRNYTGKQYQLVAGIAFVKAP